MTHLTPRRLDEDISHSLLGYLKTSEIFSDFFKYFQISEFHRLTVPI